MLLGSQADAASLAQMQLEGMLREMSFPPNHMKLKKEETSLLFAAGGSEGGREGPSSFLEQPETAFRG